MTDSEISIDANCNHSLSEEDELMLLILYAMEHNVAEVIKILDSQDNSESLVKLATQIKIDNKDGCGHAHQIYNQFLNSTSLNSRAFRKKNPEVAKIVDLLNFAALGKFPREVLPKWEQDLL